MMITEVK